MSYDIDNRLGAMKTVAIEPSEHLVSRTKMLVKIAAKSRKKAGSATLPMAMSICMAVIAFSFAVIALIELNKSGAMLSDETAAIYSLDINPSVELGVDIDKEVIQVKSLNEDGKDLLKQINCIGLDIKECIDRLIKKSVEMQYINEDDVNYIIVSEILIKDQFATIRDEIEGMDKPVTVKVVFLDGSVEDRENAGIKGISTGKEIFYEKARELGIEISEDDLAEKSITELMNGVSEDAEQIFGTTASHQVPEVNTSAFEGYIEINWGKIVDDNLRGYKVVISKDDPEPDYPENGYLAYITDPGQTSYIIDNRTKYNGGDFGGYLIDGEEYYISITAVYSDGNITGNSVLTMFSAAEEESGSTAGETSVSHDPSMINGERLSDGTIRLSWGKVESSDFKGYKIVASATNEHPKYPDDGYIRYITDRDITTLTVDGDYSGTLDMGREYYFSVTVLYEGENAAGNSVKLKYMDTQTAAARSSSTITGKRNEDGTILLTWEKIYSSDFSGYKVVASATDPEPSYPEDGYIKYITDRNETSLTVDSSFSSSLTPGTEYYFSITVLYGDSRVAGNAVKVKYMDAQTEDTQPSSTITAVRNDDGTVRLTWEKIESSGFSGYKVVASATDPHPSYPEDGYIKYITDRNETALTVDSSFSSQLTPGTEYYFSITVLYGDRKVPGNAVKVKYLDSETGSEYLSSQISGERRSDGSILLSWEKIDIAGFDGYKVVASATDPSPSYPDDGYICWITDRNTTSLLLDEGYSSVLNAGESYYFSITALYNGHAVKVPGNSVYLEYK